MQGLAAKGVLRVLSDGDYFVTRRQYALPVTPEERIEELQWLRDRKEKQVRDAFDFAMNSANVVHDRALARRAVGSLFPEILALDEQMAKLKAQLEESEGEDK